MLRPGLTSNTFRKLAADRILELATQAGATAIEWSGDCHALPGDTAAADRLRSASAAAGIAIVAHGSYYRCGVSPADDWAPVRDTALALGAPCVRVWAGNQPPGAAPARAVVDDLARICADARAHGLVVATEFHRGTATETADGACALLDAVAADNLRTLWQPYVERPASDSLAALRSVLPRMQHVHVFHRDIHEATRRLPLAEGESAWLPCIDVLRHERPDCPLLLEFVPGDDPDQYLRDAATLRRWIDAA